MKNKKIKLKIKRPKSLFFNIVGAIILGAIILGLVSFLWPKGAEAAWFDDNWKYRKKLVIDNTKVSDADSADLSNFPVLVSLSNDTGLKTQAQDDGDDILFTDASGNQLDHEIESFNQDTGALVAWVEVSTLDYNNDTAIYMYYGNSTASNQQNATGVWDNNYEGVWHLDETSDGSGAVTRNDSTSNANNLTDTNTVVSVSSGKIGSAADFEAANNESLLRTDANLATGFPGKSGESTTAFTASAWVKFETINGTTQGNNIMVKCFTSGGCSGQTLFFLWGDTTLHAEVNATSPDGSANAFNSTTEWYYITSVWDGSNVQLYVNGTASGSPAVLASYTPGTDNFMLGDRGPNNESNRQLDGLIDEARVSRSARSAGWIATEYNNQSGTGAFFSVGSEEKNKDPVLYLKFDEGQGTSALDSSPNQNTGTLAGATLPTWQSEDLCVSSKCLFFGGDPAEVTVANTVSGVKSVGFWVRPKTNGEYMLDLDGGTHYIWGNNGTITATGFSSPTIYVNSKVSSTLTANAWQYVEVTTSTAIDASAIHIGKGNTTYFTGFIDEIKMYDSVRTAAQVKTDYASRGSVKGVSAQMGGSNQSYLSNGLVGYWKMDETTDNSCTGGANDACDSSGNIRDAAYASLQETGTGEAAGDTTTIADDDNSNLVASNDAYNGMIVRITGGVGCGITTGTERTISDYAYAATPTRRITVSSAFAAETDSCDFTIDHQVAGKFGGGLQLDGGNDILTANLPGLIDSGSPSFTLSAWIKKTGNLQSNELILGKVGWHTGILGNGASNGIYCATANTTNTGFQTSGFTLTLNVWQHVTCAYDTVNSKISLYVNGQFIDDQIYTGTMYNHSDTLQVGYNGVSTDPAIVLDEARVYNRTLSPKEVSDLYSWAPGPVGYWNFEEKTGTAANDTSGNGNTASFNASPSWANGKYGGGIQLSNSDGDFLSSNDNLDFGTGSFTASAWFKINSTLSTYILGKKISNASSFSVDLMANATLQFYSRDSNSSAIAYNPTGYSVNDNKWHHVTAVRDNDNDKVYLYLDGRLLGSSADTRTGNWSPGGGEENLRLGDFHSGDSSKFDGWLDEIKIYNYARTSKQIVSDMNAGHPAVGSPVGSSVAYWDMDEGQGTTAHDLTPNAKDLTLSAASWTNSGKFGKAWNGTNAVWASRADDSDFDVTATDDYAVSLWFKSDSADNPAATEYLVNKANATTAGYAVYANTDGTVCFGIDDDTTWGPDVSSCTSTDIYDATWHHLVAIRDYSNTDKTLIYIDGVMKDSDTDSTSATLANSLSLYIGDRDGTDNGDEFSGDLDEVKVYRYALTADEVKIDYNRGSSLVLGSLSDKSGNQPLSASNEYCVPGDTTSCVAPVGEWKMEDKAGQTVVDTGSAGVNGTLGTNTTVQTSDPTWANGKYGGGLSFSNPANQRVTIGTNSQFNITGDLTIEAWINPSTVAASGEIFARESFQTGGYKFILSGYGNQLAYITDDVGHQYSVVWANTIYPNIWQHLVLTQSGNTATLYINGVSKGGQTITPPASANQTAAFGGGGGIGGLMDEVKIFNYARTPAQIAWDYNRGKPTAYWDFDECQGGSVYDLSGNNNTGTITIGTGVGSTQDAVGTCTANAATAWYNGRTGKFNSSLNLDGIDDYVSVADSATNKFSTAFSLSAWVNLAALPTTDGCNTGAATIINKGRDTTSTYSYALEVDKYSDCSGSGYPAFLKLYDGSANPTIAGKTSLNTGQWYHIVGTYDGSTLKIYVNGKLENSTAATIDLGTQTSAVAIGKNANADNRYLNGQIDEAKIFNYALTSTQVKDLYNNGAVWFGPSTGNP